MRAGCKSGNDNSNANARQLRFYAIAQSNTLRQFVFTVAAPDRLLGRVILIADV